MPLYEFVCDSCSRKFEELCSSEVDTAKCPRCGGPAKKVLSLFSAGKSSSGRSIGGSGGCGG